MQRSETSLATVSANDLPNMRRTMELRFIKGKLHQKWINDDATIEQWRIVDGT